MKNTIYKLTFCTIAIIAIAFTLTTSAHAASPGALDSTFDVDGKKSFLNINGLTLFTSNSSEAMTVQPDGKILIAGTNNSSDSLSVVRLNANGSFDTTFSSDGLASVVINDSNVRANTVAVHPNGKILLLGKTSFDFALAQLNSDGSIDTTFGTNGVVITDFLTLRDEGTHLRILDGKIIAAGSAQNTSGEGEAAVARYNSNGTLDTTFSGDGKTTITTNVTATTSTRGVATQADGRILLGISAPINNGDFAIFRLTTTGNVDTTFDGDGIVTTDFLGFDFFTSIKIQSDGRIVAAGNSRIASGSNGFLALARYNTNGSLDTTFGIGGKATLSPNSSFSHFLSEMEIQENGKIIVGYQGLEGVGTQAATGLALARFNSNGTRDFSFADSGFSKTRADLTVNEFTRSIKLLGNKVVVFANTGGPNSNFAVGRFNLDIQPTQSGDFDGDGFTDTAVFRPSTGTWFVLQSSDNVVTFSQFGSNGDVPIDGDFDGDGRNDLAVYKPTVGQWWFQRSSDNTVFAAQFGTSTDKPSSGDYDKDGKTDIAFFRPSTGEWLVLRSSSNFSTFFGYPFGANGDIPIVRKGA